MVPMTMTQTPSNRPSTSRSAARAPMSNNVFGGYLLGGILIVSGLLLIVSGTVAMLGGA